MSARDILLFALQDSRDFGEGVATRLATTLSDLEESDFEDGEHKARPVEDVSGREVFVIQSLFSDNRHSVNDKLCRLLFLIGALKDARAASVTAVIPYLCYARQDRKAQPQEPISSRYVAQLLEAMGTDRLIVMDVHDLAALENAFRCPTDHLEAFPLFVEHFAALLGSEPAVVVSPDIGGTRRALRFSSAFAEACHSEIDTAFVEKHRSGGTIKSGAFAGKIEDRNAIIIDDLISTGGTILRAARACREHGARRIFAVATHGIFAVEANAVMAGDLLEQVVITNTGPIYRIDPELVGKKVVILDAAPLIAAAIDRIRTRGSH